MIRSFDEIVELTEENKSDWPPPSKSVRWGCSNYLSLERAFCGTWWN